MELKLIINKLARIITVTELFHGGLLQLGLSIADYIVLAVGLLILTAVSLALVKIKRAVNIVIKKDFDFILFFFFIPFSISIFSNPLKHNLEKNLIDYVCCEKNTMKKQQNTM